MKSPIMTLSQKAPRIIVTISLLTYILISLLCSCKQQTETIHGSFDIAIINDTTDLRIHLESPYEDPMHVSRNIPIWNYYIKSAQDSLLRNVLESYRQECIEKKYKEGEIYSTVFLTQTYLFQGSNDSLQINLNRLQSYQIADPKLRNLANNILAIHFLKNELDYAKSIDYLTKSYEFHKAGANYEGMVINLCNISSIFYYRSDPTGIEFARQANTLCKEHNIRGNLTTASNLALSRMLLLNNMLDSAQTSIQHTLELAEQYNVLTLMTDINVTKALIYHELNNAELSNAYFEIASKTLKYADIGVRSEYYYHHGRFLEEQKQYTRALKMYQEGLNISKIHKNIQNEANLLLAITNYYYNLKDTLRGLEYYMMYNNHQDSILAQQTEREFNTFRLQNQKSEYEQELQAKEIALLKHKKQIITIISILVLFIITVISIWLVVYNKIKTDRKLVQQYQRYLNIKKIYSEDKKNTDTTNDDPDKLLFEQIDRLMREEKVYRDCNLNIDMIADKLKTNRKYISKAINQYSGHNFFYFINQFRVEEATKLLTQSDLLLKQISTKVGYSNVTSFYRAFNKEVGCAPSVYRSNFNSLGEEKTSDIEE